MNYQENDKILTLFSVDLGKITAGLKGCRKQNAKLKFAGQPFVFGEFKLIKKGDKYTVATVSEIESFFDICQNWDLLKIGSAMLEISNIVLNEGEPFPNLFVTLLKCLRQIAFETNVAKAVFIKFVLEIFSGTGYEMQFDKCCQCGGASNTHIILDFDLGNLVCGLCKGNNCLEIQPANYYVLKLISKTPFDRLSSIKFNDKIFYELVDALISNFEFRFGKKLKSL